MSDIDCIFGWFYWLSITIDFLGRASKNWEEIDFLYNLQFCLHLPFPGFEFFFRSTTFYFLVDMLSCDWPINTWIQLWKVITKKLDELWVGEIRSKHNKWWHVFMLLQAWSWLLQNQRMMIWNFLLKVIFAKTQKIFPLWWFDLW